MKSASRKAKGRRLQNDVVAAIKQRLGYDDPDVRPAIMGEGGMDIKLSSAARKGFPFKVECKNQERLSIWKALEQAESHDEPGLMAAVIFKRNRSDTYIALRFDDLLTLLGE